MIVLSSGLILAEAAGGPNLLHPLIGWHNLVTVAGISATSEADGFPASNLANPATHLKWVSSPDSPSVEQYITIITDTVDLMDYVGIARHNFGSAAITVSVEYLDTGFSPPEWTELVQETILADDDPVIFRFAPQSIAEIRIRLQPGTEAPEAAVVYVGKLLVMERGLAITPHTPLDFGREVKVVDGMSESGEFLGSIEVGGHSESLAEFQYLTPSWYRTYFDSFVRRQPRAPFFFAWNPSIYPFEVGYAWNTSSPKPAYDYATDRMSVQIPMRGIT